MNRTSVVVLSLLLAPIAFSQSALHFSQARLDYEVARLPWSVATGDFNNDGRSDFVTCSRAERNVTVRLGRGNGTFGDTANFSVGISPRCVVVRDFNRDGNPDIATANLLSNDASVLLGRGDGTFNPATAYAVGQAERWIIAADFNRDTVLDLAVANRDGNSISILRGNGNGTFQQAVNYSTSSLVNPRQMVAADFTGDGVLDLAAVHDSPEGTFPVPRAVLLQGNAGSTFGIPVTVSLPSNPDQFPETFSLTSGDFNHDGLADLAVAIGASQTGWIQILLSNGNTTFTPSQQLPVDRSAFFIANADFNRDGIPDLAVVDARLGLLTLHLGNGNGTFRNALSGSGWFVDNDNAFSTNSSPRSLAVADLNADGRLDVLSANEGMSTVSVFIANGDSTFVSAPNYSVGAPPQASAIGGITGDFNRDGNRDIAVANFGFPLPGTRGVISVLLGIGDGMFQPRRNYLVGLAPKDIVAGRFNKDIFTDLAVLNSRDTVVSVLLGRADGTFVDAVQFSLEYALDQPNMTAIVSADFNEDGKVDLAVNDYNQRQISILYGDGNGAFGNLAREGVLPLSTELQSGDFNNDGHADLLYGGNDGSGIQNYVALRIGNGNGTFAAPVQTLVPGSFPETPLTSLTAANLNADTRLDLAVVVREAGEVYVMTGNSDGTFTLNSTLQISLPENAAPVDLNADGNVDLVIASDKNSTATTFTGNGDGTFKRVAASFGVNGKMYKLIPGDFDNDGDIDFVATKFLGNNSVSTLLNTSSVTAVEDPESEKVPMAFRLEQNYPNPFNPTTTIGFSVPASSASNQASGFITLKVFDLLGREIRTLVQQKLVGGEYTIEFNASDLPSGVYFYRVTSGGFVGTKRMMLLK